MSVESDMPMTVAEISRLQAKLAEADPTYCAVTKIKGPKLVEISIVFEGDQGPQIVSEHEFFVYNGQTLSLEVVKIDADGTGPEMETRNEEGEEGEGEEGKV